MRNVTIAEIKKQARTRADMRNSSFVSDTELLVLINEAYTEMYDLLVSAFENYYTQTYSFAVSSASQSYAMPSDFYKIIGVDFEVSLGQYITLHPYRELDRNGSFTSIGNIPTGNIKLRYVPIPQVFTADTDTIDGVAGWEALLVTDVAIMMLDQEEANTDRLELRRKRIYTRITQMSQNRDIGMPATISDVYSSIIPRIFSALRYRLYGNNMEFISTEFTGSNTGFFY